MRHLANKKREQLLQAEIKEPHLKQQIADSYVVIVCFLVQQYRDRNCRTAILNEMIDATPYGVNQTFAKCIYFAKMARTNLEHYLFHQIFNWNAQGTMR